MIAGSTLRLSLVALTLSVAACSAGSSVVAGSTVSSDPARSDVTIEEPDLYRLQGSTLYVQNRSSGLNILDVSDPARPGLVGRAALSGTSAAELYVQPNSLVVVLLSSATDACRPLAGLDAPGGAEERSELVLIDAEHPASPEILGRYCLPGKMVASRTVDSVLYAVTGPAAAPIDTAGRSQAFSIDLAVPRAPQLVAHEILLGSSTQILLTETTLVVASQDTVSASDRTRVAFFAIDAHGKLDPAGETSVPGAPQGRFHMDLQGRQLRIVTFDGGSSRLSILDASDPAHLEIIGTLTGIGPAERLYATRFDGDLAYVVTFRRTDPLWVLSLKDPQHPVIAGELRVPGYSDYLFPRGDHLVAVGRGADGRSLGLSLFDVSDPSSPAVLDQVQLGVDATSEANLDHRGVSILEQMPGGGLPAIVIPYADVARSYSDGRSSCTVRNHLQIVDLDKRSLVPRGRADLRGAVRRSFLVGDALYGLSDYEVKALAVGDRNAPDALAQVTVGTDDGLRASTAATCDASGYGIDSYGCSMAGGAREQGGSLLLIGLALLLVSRRQGARRPLRPALVALGAFVVCTSFSGRALAEPACEAAEPECGVGPDAAAAAPWLSPDQPRPAPGYLELERPHTQQIAVEKPRLGLGVAGINVFFASWLLTAGVGYLTNNNTLSIPVFGPFVYMAQYRERFDCKNTDPETVVSCRSESTGDRMVYGGLVLSAIVQAGGLAMIGAGFGTKSKVFAVAVAPSFSPQQGGLTVLGRF